MPGEEASNMMRRTEHLEDLADIRNLNEEDLLIVRFTSMCDDNKLKTVMSKAKGCKKILTTWWPGLLPWALS